MKCPKCGKPMTSFYCLHCGYMRNGKMISKFESNPNASDLEIYLGDRFDKIFRNENSWVIFLLGPFYFCLNKLVALGVFCFILDLILYRIFLIFCTSFTSLKFIFFFLFIRVCYMTCANMIYMKFLKKEIEQIKLKNPDNYLDILRDANGKSTNLWYLALGMFISAALVVIILAIATFI